MADPMRARGVVARLREMGVKVAIDDFGLGYSSLGYLKNLPVNDLKIDKSFVINMMEDQGDAVIVQSTIDLAHNLGLTVIAEGVESDETWRRLRDAGMRRRTGLADRPAAACGRLRDVAQPRRVHAAGGALVGCLTRAPRRRSRAGTTSACGCGGRRARRTAAGSARGRARTRGGRRAARRRSG